MGSSSSRSRRSNDNRKGSVPPPLVSASDVETEDEFDDDDNHDENNNKATLQMVPDDVLVTHVAKFLRQTEVVRGVAATSRYFATLFKRRFGILREMFPLELEEEREALREDAGVPGGWQCVGAVKLMTTEWGIPYEDFVARIPRDENNRGFSLRNVMMRIMALKRGGEFKAEKVPIEYFNLQQLKVWRVKSLFLERISLDVASLVSLESLEAIHFKSCHFLPALETFPPRLRSLKFEACSSPGSLFVLVESFPESLETLTCNNIFVSLSKKTRSFFPSGLLNLNLINLSEEGPEGVKIPGIIFPEKLKTLRVSNMPSYIFLSFVELKELESIEVAACNDMITIPMTPLSLQRLRRMKLSWCAELRFFSFPSHLVELELTNCEKLMIDFERLPSSLEKFSIISCKLINNATHLGRFPILLKELNLHGFENLATLPNFPPHLRSLILKVCENLQNLPPLPQTLTRLDLSRLYQLTSLVLPSHLECLSLYDCKNLGRIDCIPQKLRSLKLERMPGLHFTHPELPKTLQTLELAICPTLNIDISRLPPRLENLRLRSLPSKHMPFSFPEKLLRLSLNRIDGLSSIPNLPDSLQEFELFDCSSVTRFPPLPPGLKTLSVSFCEQIRTIGLEKTLFLGGISGRLPDSLISLNVNSCMALENLGSLPENLRTLELKRSGAQPIFLQTLPRRLQTVYIY